MENLTRSSDYVPRERISGNNRLSAVSALYHFDQAVVITCLSKSCPFYLVCPLRLANQIALSEYQ